MVTDEFWERAINGVMRLHQIRMIPEGRIFYCRKCPATSESSSVRRPSRPKDQQIFREQERCNQRDHTPRCFAVFRVAANGRRDALLTSKVRIGLAGSWFRNVTRHRDNVLVNGWAHSFSGTFARDPISRSRFANLIVMKERYCKRLFLGELLATPRLSSAPLGNGGSAFVLASRVCASLTAHSLCLENRAANLRGGPDRWM